MLLIKVSPPAVSVRDYARSGNNRVAGSRGRPRETSAWQSFCQCSMDLPRTCVAFVFAPSARQRLYHAEVFFIWHWYRWSRQVRNNLLPLPVLYDSLLYLRWCHDLTLQLLLISLFRQPFVLLLRNQLWCTWNLVMLITSFLQTKVRAT